MWCHFRHTIKTDTRLAVVVIALHSFSSPSNEIFITLLAQRENGQMKCMPVRFLPANTMKVIRSDVHFTTDDRLDASFLRRLVKDRSTAHPTVIGQTDGAPTQLDRTINHRLWGAV